MSPSVWTANTKLQNAHTAEQNARLQMMRHHMAMMNHAIATMDAMVPLPPFGPYVELPPMPSSGPVTPMCLGGEP
jgi:hypothetical protein